MIDLKRYILGKPLDKPTTSPNKSIAIFISVIANENGIFPVGSLTILKKAKNPALVIHFIMSPTLETRMYPRLYSSKRSLDMTVGSPNY